MSDTAYLTGKSNTPTIQSSATALAANTARRSWLIQNQGTNPLFVLCGSGASTTVFNIILKAAGAQDDGTGGAVSEDGTAIYTGIITVAGTSPRYTVYEVAP